MYLYVRWLWVQFPWLALKHASTCVPGHDSVQPPATPSSSQGISTGILGVGTLGCVGGMGSGVGIGVGTGMGLGTGVGVGTVGMTFRTALTPSPNQIGTYVRTCACWTSLTIMYCLYPILLIMRMREKDRKMTTHVSLLYFHINVNLSSSPILLTQAFFSTSPHRRWSCRLTSNGITRPRQRGIHICPKPFLLPHSHPSTRQGYI